jgi:hypothetical protein
MHFAVADFEHCYRYRKLEAARPCTAGINEEYAVLIIDYRAVRMPRDDNAESGGFGIKVEVADIVHAVDRNPADFNSFGRLNRVSPHSEIIVAAHGDNRRDSAQLIQNLRTANIAGVQDVIDSGKRAYCLRTHEVVGVGNQADFKGFVGHDNAKVIAS